MEIKVGQSVITGTNATVVMKSVGYTDPRGKFHIITVQAQHLVFLVSHEQSEATLLIRPSGVQYVPPVK